MSFPRRVGAEVPEKERNMGGNYNIICHICLTEFNKDEAKKC